MNLLNKSAFAAFAMLAASGAFAQDDTIRFESSEEYAMLREPTDEEKSPAADEGDMSKKGESEEKDDR